MPKHDLPYAMETVGFPASLSAQKAPQGRIFGYGTTVGNGAQGWAPGAMFIHTDGEVFGLNYINVNTATSATWIPAGAIPAIERITKFSVFEDDFMSDAHTYTDTNDGATGTNAWGTSYAGWYNVVTAAVDNDYHLMSTKGRIADINFGNPFWYEARFQLAEANTDASNWVVGLSDTLTTGFLQNDGGGPPANYEGSVFFKLDGDMTVYFENAHSGVNQTQSMGTFTSNIACRVGIHYDGLVTMTPFLNGTAGTPVTVTIASEANYGVFGVKAGSGNAETLQMDYHRAVQYYSSTR